jgi:hypothetical protein
MDNSSGAANYYSNQNPAISNEKGYMEPKKWFDIYKKMIHEN